MNSAIEFVTGIGLFLFAMKQLELSLERYAGKKFQRQIEAKTNSKLQAITTGTIATAFLQSSSLVGLITLALCGAGILPLLNAIGVMLGANLGTTLTGWLVTLIGFKLNLGDFALYIIGISGLCNVILNKSKSSHIFMFFISFGLLIIGLDMMKGSASGIAKLVNINEFKEQSALYFLLIGIFLSAVIQSSSAVMIISLSALNIGVIELHHAGALIIGADLGTTSTVIIGSLKGDIIKRQLAFAHFIFNLLTNLLAFIFLLPFIYKIMSFFNIHDPLYSLVLFHSLFNLMGIIIFFPWLEKLSNFIKSILLSKTKHYTNYISKVPGSYAPIALKALNNEVKSLLIKVLSVYQNYSSSQQDSLYDEYITFKHIEGDIIRYVKTIQQQKLTLSESEKLNSLSRAVRYSIFSQKSLNDVESDIKNIYDANKDLKGLSLTSEFLSFFSSSAQKLKQVIETSDELVLNRSSNENSINEDNIHKQIESLRVDLKIHYLRNKDEFYSSDFEASLSSVEVSSLLNLNREIYTSSNNAIKAVESYLGGDYRL